MSGTLMTHCGARDVSRNELICMDAPPGTDTWHPIEHHDVLRTVETTLEQAGFGYKTTSLAVSHDDKRFFGVLDLHSPVVDGVSLVCWDSQFQRQDFPDRILRRQSHVRL